MWLDAHADFNTPATSPSGNMHGMSAAALCGEPGLDGIFVNLERVCSIFELISNLRGLAWQFLGLANGNESGP